MMGTNILIKDFNFPEIAWEEGRAGAKGRPFFGVGQIHAAARRRRNTLAVIRAI